MQPDVPTARDEYVIDDFVVSEGDEHAPLEHSSRVDIDVQNIVTGKRKRRATRTIYDEPEFAGALAEQMMSDIPESERGAALWDECDDAVIDTDDEPEHSSDEDEPAGESEDEPAGESEDEPVGGSPSPSGPSPAEDAQPCGAASRTFPVDSAPAESDDEDYNPSGSGSDSDVELDDSE